jgi:hypothetical protein
MVAHGIGIDQQGIGNIFGAPAACQHHRLDAVGLALVAGAAVRRTQLGKLFGRQTVVHHGCDDTMHSDC